MLCPTLCELDIEEERIEIFSDENEYILFLFRRILDCFDSEPCSYFLYEKSLLWITREMNKSLHPIYLIGELTEELREQHMIKEIITLVDTISECFTVGMIIFGMGHLIGIFK